MRPAARVRGLLARTGGASVEPAPDPAGAESDPVESGLPAAAAPPAAPKRPFYPRLLRLRHVSPNGWQRAALGEGVLAVAAVLVLADVATAWTLLVLPLAVAAVVKAHDVLAGVLTPRRDRAATGPERDSAGALRDTGAADAGGG